MKKIISLLICLCMLLAMPISAMAAQEANMIQGVWIDGQDMMIICADGTDSAGTYEVRLDDQRIPVEESNVRNDKIPVTVFCLVDTSGSISEFKMRLIRETLTELSNSLGGEDNMVIATIGNQLTVGPVLQTREEREAAIDSIQVTHDDTNLYSCIVQSMEKLISDTSYNPYGCVVVLSDGSDQQDNGMTEQEVMNAVQAAKRPLYTVALIEKAEEREGGKVMGSFARNSYGGEHQTTVSEGANNPVRRDMNGDEFGSVIWNSLQGMSVLWGDLSGVNVPADKTKILLDVTYVSGSDSYTDDMELDATVITPVPPVTIPPETYPETTEPTETVVVTTETIAEIPIWKKPVFLVAVAAGVILIGVAVLLVIRSRSGKVQQDPGQFSDVMPGIQNLDVTKGIIEDTAGTTLGDIDTTWGAPGRTGKPGTTIQCKVYKVYMTDIPYGTLKMNFRVNEKEITTFGRDQKRVNFVLNSKDTQLSGKHFSLNLQEKGYCIQDENSTNGTYLNGVSISGKGWIKLHSEDKIRAGAYEYRIIIKEE